jgi:hypothetical protein
MSLLKKVFSLTKEEQTTLLKELEKKAATSSPIALPKEVIETLEAPEEVNLEVELANIKQEVLSEVQAIQITAPKGDKGEKGDKGDQGRPGIDGKNGKNGKDGVDGKDGKDGEQGVSVVDATVDFDNGLSLELSNGKVIDAGTINIPDSIANSFQSLKQYGKSTLASLEDVNVASATDNQVLSYDYASSTWIPVTVSGTGGGGAVDSVNGFTGTVVLTAANVGAEPANATILKSANIGVTVQGYNANTVIDASYVHTDNNYTTAEKNKLAGIAAGAEVNVNADWNATSGDAQILNKPTLFSGAYNDLTGKPTLGTAAAQDSSAFATAAQGALATTALQSYTETDPIYTASSWYSTTNNSSNWNTAYGWGNHASAGYLTSGAIGTTVQAYDADLTSWAAITPSTKQDTLVSGTSIKTINGNSLLGSGDLTISGGGSGTVTNVSIVSANGLAGTVATSTTTPAITLSTTVTGLLKGNGTAISAATSGSDYAPATSGTSILYGNGSGGFSNVTVGTGLSFSSGTLSSTNTGTVTSVTGTAPIASTGGATPAISISQASTSTDGYLSSTDWNTFNNKGNGTVTSVSALTLGTTGTDLSSTVATGTTTPVITLNVPTASATNRGALSSADWTTFNGKQTAYTNLTTIGSLANGVGWLYNNGSGTFSYSTPTASDVGAVPTARTLTINGTAFDLTANRTWSVGTVTSVSALTIGTAGTDIASTVATGTTTPVITLNVPTASASNRGALSSTDWSTFNNKQETLVSGTNIKTINGSSILGSGNLTISGGSGSGQLRLTFSTASTIWTNMPAAVTLLFGTASAIIKADLSTYTQCRLLVNKLAVAGNTNSKLILEYATTYTQTATSYLDIGTTEVSCAATGTNTYVDSGWINLAAGAKADVFITVTGINGNGTLDPVFGSITAEFK